MYSRKKKGQITRNIHLFTTLFHFSLFISTYAVMLIKIEHEEKSAHEGVLVGKRASWCHQISSMSLSYKYVNAVLFLHVPKYFIWLSHH